MESPDGTCGPEKGYICPVGECCSQAGWCGKGTPWCKDPEVCQPLYGECDSSKTPAGASTLNDPRPKLGNVTYTDDVYRCVKPNTVALTFDDGPREFTEQMLDTLKQYNFTATFFVTGNNFGKGAIDTTPTWSNLIQRMIAEGHQVASHTWSHYNLSGLNQTARLQQVRFTLAGMRRAALANALQTDGKKRNGFP